MKTVLAIDDNKEQRKQYKEIFKKHGIDVLEAPDALEVSNIIMRDKDKIGLILLDLQIDEVDGRDIYGIIRDYTTSIPIIVSSVLPIKDQKLKIPHARGYHQKSEGNESLLNKVQTILG